jgi:ribosome-associated translation inhibitor RaiA
VIPVEIVFRSHHTQVSDHMRRRAELAVEKVARRLTRAVSAVVRFEADGRERRVEIVLHAAHNRRLVANGTGRFFGTALAAAVARVEAQTNHAKRPAKERARRAARGKA